MKRSIIKICYITIFTLFVISCEKSKNENSEEIKKNVLEEKEEKHYQEPLYKFAISNRDGSKFLLMRFDDERLLDSSEANEYKFVIYNKNIYNVKYEGVQSEDTINNNFRHTFRNFKNLAGVIFQNKDGKIFSPILNDEYSGVKNSILLVNQGFLDQYKFIKNIKKVDIQANKEIRDFLTNKYKRKIVFARVEYLFGENEENKFIVAQMETKDNKAYGLYIVVTESGKMIYKEYPAEVDHPVCLWRVDDDGVFFVPEILAIFVHNNNFVFQIDDVGIEGIDSFILRQSGDQLIEDDYRLSRYTVPE